MIRPWCLLGALLVVRPALADPEPAPLDVSAARVLASPGWPRALAPFLPPGRSVEPLALPLPPGPLLVLGLLDRDPVARGLAATRLGLEGAHGPLLGGGYAVAAERDGDRPLVLLLADDAAALAAARFELETFAPGAPRTEPREVDVSKPDEQGGVRVAAGRRRVRPHYRVRTAGGLGPGETWLDVVAARANRAWVPADVADRDLALLRDHGVLPVARGAWELDVPFDWDAQPSTRPILDLLLRPLLEAQARGVRHFALDLRIETQDQVQPVAAFHARVVRAVAAALRPQGLEELLVIPASFDGEGVARFGPPPDLRGIPEARLGWQGPGDRPLAITRAQAQRVREEAGVPAVLVETWMAAAAPPSYLRPRLALRGVASSRTLPRDVPVRFPSLPRGRAADLGEALEGLVVLPGPGAAAALAASWAPPTDGEPWVELAELLGACARDATDGHTFLLDTAACLQENVVGRYAEPPWLEGLAERLRAASALLPPPEITLLARWTSEAVQVDGRLDEPLWSTAAPRTLPASLDATPPSTAVVLRAVSSGGRLVLGLRVPDGLAAKRLGVAVGWPWGEGAALEVALPVGGERTAFPDGAWAAARAPGGQELEVAFDHYALNGDAYPTRAFALHAFVVRPGGPGRPDVTESLGPLAPPEVGPLPTHRDLPARSPAVLVVR